MTAVLEPPAMDTVTPVARNGAVSTSPGLFEKAVCLVLSLRKPGNRRKLPASLVEVDADKELISAQKTLLASEHLKAIAHYDGEIRRYLYSRCLPSLFMAGVYLVPIALVEEVEAKLATFAGTRGHLVDAFIEAYPRLVESARTRLRSAFNEKDYPSADHVRLSFKMEWRYVAFSVPGTLQTISSELFRKEQEKASLQWQEAMEEIRALLRTHLSEMVNHLVDRLRQPTEGGKPKVFKNTLVTNLTSFLDTFDARNLTDDTELAEVVTRARSLLGGIDAQTLRTSDALRSSLCTGFSELKSTLDALVIARPMRAFSFEEE
jgi:hypothetical protein